MDYAPVVIFAYNRAAEIRVVMQALAANTLAKKTPVFVFSNAPLPVTGDTQRVAEVRWELSHYKECFGSYTVIERDENRGANENMLFGISQVVKQYGRVIVLEDDIVTGKSFLTFMNQALEAYQSDKDIFSICGYNPVNRKVPQLPGDSFTYDAFRSWGWATWADRFELFDPDETTVWDIDLPKVHTEGLMYISCIRQDIVYDCPNNPERFLDFKLACTQMAHNMTVLYSKESLCDNIGMTTNSLTSSNSSFVNHNFRKELNQDDFALSKEKLTIDSAPDYFSEFRWSEFAMDIYFESNYNRELLYGVMYHGLINIYSQGGSIGYYFTKHNIRSIAIYGWGNAGRLLAKLLEKEKIKVAYILDRAQKDTGGLPLYHSFEQLPPVDAIVVTALRDFPMIEEMLNRFVQMPVLSLDDITTECMVDIVSRKVL